MTERMIHCANCRKSYPESQMKREPLDFVQGDDGKPIASMERYAIFCGVCETGLGLYDTARDKTIAQFKKKPAGTQPATPPQPPRI